MTIEQKKISLINWITNLEDEKVLDKIVGLQRSNFEALPESIVKLLKQSESEPESNLIKHSNTRDILNMQ